MITRKKLVVIHYMRIAIIPFCILFVLACGGANRPANDRTKPLQRKNISRKDFYHVYINSDNTQTRKLERSELFDHNGNLLEQIIWIPDSTYLGYNRCKVYIMALAKTETSISDRYTFQYSSNELSVITSFMCDSLPLQKQFFSYEKDSAGKTVKTEELIYQYKRHKFELKELASIGDSILVSAYSTAIHYHRNGMKSETSTVRTSSDGFKRLEKTITYFYNRERRLEKQVEKNTEYTEISLYEYGSKGELLKVTWEEPTPATLLYQYDSLGRKIQDVAQGGITDIVTTYTYNSNGDLIKSVRADGFTVKIEETEYVYFD